MRLHTFPSAPNPRRVHIFAAEKGIDLPCRHVDILKRENRSPEFIRDVDVMGRVPVLELDDGTRIAESIAICRYLEALHPEPPLLGRSAVEQGQVEMWLRRIELDFMMPLGLVWAHGSPLTAAVVKHQIPEVAEQSRKVVQRYLAFLDRQLADRPHIAGDDFTLADIVALCTLDFAIQLNGFELAPEQTHLAEWFDRVSSRPSAKK